MQFRLRTLLIMLAISGVALAQQPPRERRWHDDIDRLDELLLNFIERARQKTKEDYQAAEQEKYDRELRAAEVLFGIPGLLFPVNVERAMQVDYVPIFRSNA